jgi:protein O-mannosyl-transferase
MKKMQNPKNQGKTRSKAPVVVKPKLLEEKQPRKNMYFIGIILILTLFVYFPSIQNDLLKTWDDQAYVTNNELITSLSAGNIARIFREDRGLYANYHPLTTLSLAVNYHISGLSPAGYRITNIFLHLLNTILVFVFIYLLTGKKAEVAFIVSLLFGVHPMHVESVAWISERKDVLYTFFFLASLIFYQFYLKNKDYRFYILSILVFFCSLLSKAMAASLPLVLLLIDFWTKRKLNLRVVAEKIPFLILAVILGLYAIQVQAEGHATSRMMFSWSNRLLHASYGFIMYIYQLGFPISLSAFYPYPYPLINSAWVMNTTPAILFLTLVIFIGLWILFTLAVIRHWKFAREVAFGILFYAFTIALVLQILPVGRAVMADRYSYIPSIGLFFILAIFLVEIYHRQKFKTLAISAVIVYTVFLSFLTYKRCEVWKNDESLWNDVIGKYPEDNRVALAVYNRGKYFEVEEKYKEALSDYLTVANYSTRDDNILERIGKIYGQKLNDLDNALVYFQKAYEINPSNLDVLRDLGTAYGIKGDPKTSLVYSLKGLAIKPDDPLLLMNAGISYQSLGETVKAREYFEKAKKIDPDLNSK